MSAKTDSSPAPRRIDAAAKAVFLAALRSGARREDAAAGAGFSLTGFYGARRRDSAFQAAWDEALAAAPAAERRVRAYAERGEVRIASANRRLYQRRRRRHVRFDERRQEIFLTHFAANCDTTAAAAAAEAGVSESTVHLHCRTDPAFAEAYSLALEQGLTCLEAEALRQRLAAQKRLRAAVEAAGPAARVSADEAEEFDRLMRLFARWDRKPRRPDSRFSEGGRRQAWSFEEAIVVLDKKLRAFGLRRGIAPPEEDEPAEGGE